MTDYCSAERSIEYSRSNREVCLTRRDAGIGEGAQVPTTLNPGAPKRKSGNGRRQIRPPVILNLEETESRPDAWATPGSGDTPPPIDFPAKQGRYSRIRVHTRVIPCYRVSDLLGFINQ